MIGIQMCEVIAAYWRATTGKAVDPLAIWNYSPTGELFMVFHWFWEACAFFESRDLPEIVAMLSPVAGREPRC